MVYKFYHNKAVTNKREMSSSWGHLEGQIWYMKRLVGCWALPGARNQELSLPTPGQQPADPASCPILSVAWNANSYLIGGLGFNRDVQAQKAGLCLWRSEALPNSGSAPLPYLVLLVLIQDLQGLHGPDHSLHGGEDVLVDQLGKAPLVLLRVSSTMDDAHLLDECALPTLARPYSETQPPEMVGPRPLPAQE